MQRLARVVHKNGTNNVIDELVMTAVNPQAKKLSNQKAVNVLTNLFQKKIRNNSNRKRFIRKKIPLSCCKGYRQQTNYLMLKVNNELVKTSRSVKYEQYTST